MYILGIDFGEARIGLALSSSLARLPAPYGVLPADESIFSNIAAIVVKEDVSKVVVGLPRNMSGTETAQSASIRQFTGELKKHVSVDIVFADESLSTKRAEALRSELKDRPKGAAIDDLAACFILEEFFKGV